MGNVLGAPGTAVANGPSSDCSQPGLWRIGCHSDSSGESPPAGSSVLSTLVHCGNQSYATSAGTSPASGFAGASLPGVDAACAGALPASYYLACKPAWFGSFPWPPIWPDVVGYASDIPAKRMYEHGSYTAGCP